MAIHIGCGAPGWPGLLVAGVCFILPAVLIVTARSRGSTSASAAARALEALLYGVKPVVIAVVAAGAVAVSAGTALEASAGLVVAAVARGRRRGDGRSRARRSSFAAGAGAVARQPRAALRRARGHHSRPRRCRFDARCCLVFLKIGSVLFGSGYVLLAFLRADLVERLGWLTEAQLLDAVAVGQVTPGPVFTTATFVGYILGRSRGCGGGDDRHLPAGLLLRRDERAVPAAAAPVQSRGRLPRRRQRRVSGADGGRDLAARRAAPSTTSSRPCWPSRRASCSSGTG